jgi:hypothetical protein
MRSRRPRAPVAAVAASLALGAWQGGCGGGAPSPAEVRCEPVDAAARPEGDARTMAGSYRLTLIATSGPAEGRSVYGTLRLTPFARPASPPAGTGADPIYHHYGGAELEIAAVGAVAPGAVAPETPSAPGVLVMEWDAGQGRTIALRFGSEANRRELLRFDGAHLTLFVRSMGTDRFAGRWESGDGERTASGHFCAARTAPDR